MGSADYFWVATPMGLGLMYLLWLLRGWRTEQQKKVDAYYEKKHQEGLDGTSFRIFAKKYKTNKWIVRLIDCACYFVFTASITLVFLGSRPTITYLFHQLEIYWKSRKSHF